MREDGTLYAFIHIDKTGGSTLTAILRRSFGTRHCDVRLPMAKRRNYERGNRPCIDAKDLRRVQWLYRNLCGISGHYIKPYSDLARRYPDLRFFTFLRDPSARFRSQYLNRSRSHTESAFYDWVDARWTHNWQTKMIAGEPNAEKAIDILAHRVGFVGLTERFDESVVMLGEYLGEPGFRAEYRPANQLSRKRRPRDQARRHTDLSYLKTDRVRSILAEVNAEDQKVYDFVKATVFPAQLKRYARDLPSKVRSLQERSRKARLLIESPWAGFYRNFIYEPLVRCYAF